MKKKLAKSILKYSVIFEEDNDGGFAAWVPDLPGCASQGDSLEEVIENIKEAIGLYVEDDDLAVSVRQKRQFILPVSITRYA